MGNSNECATYDSGIWDPDEAPDALEGETTPNAGIYLLLKIYMKGKYYCLSYTKENLDCRQPDGNEQTCYEDDEARVFHEPGTNPLHW